MRFRYKYLTSLRYKNIYITKRFHEIDKARVDVGMESILPLTFKERDSLVEVTSIMFVWSEWRHIFSSSVFLIFSTLHICGILLADYSLYWLLSMIHFYGNQENGIENEGVKPLIR